LTATASAYSRCQVTPDVVTTIQPFTRWDGGGITKNKRTSRYGLVLRKDDLQPIYRSKNGLIGRVDEYFAGVSANHHRAQAVSMKNAANLSLQTPQPLFSAGRIIIRWFQRKYILTKLLRCLRHHTRVTLLRLGAYIARDDSFGDCLVVRRAR